MGTVRERLVFDVGMYTGDDTAYYLSRGYDVVAVEANPELVLGAKRRFSDSLVEGRLTIVEAAVVRDGGGMADFHVSSKRSMSSLVRRSAEGGGYARSIRVATTTLPSLIEQFGVPFYCKIDIESADLDALQSLEGEPLLPQYISAECGGLPGEPVYDGQAGLATLAQLEVLCYRRFKLVDQDTLRVLPVDRRVYSRQQTFVDRLASRLGRPRETWRRRYLYHRLHHHFSLASSGPFGDGLTGDWVDARTARQMLEFHAADIAQASLPPSAFRCDWHAMR